MTTPTTPVTDEQLAAARKIVNYWAEIVGLDSDSALDGNTIDELVATVAHSYADREAAVREQCAVIAETYYSCSGQYIAGQIRAAATAPAGNCDGGEKGNQ